MVCIKVIHYPGYPDRAFEAENTSRKPGVSIGLIWTVAWAKCNSKSTNCIRSCQYAWPPYLDDTVLNAQVYVGQAMSFILSRKCGRTSTIGPSQLSGIPTNHVPKVFGS